jgi:hypothetical protein
MKTIKIVNIDNRKLEHFLINSSIYNNYVHWMFY